MADKLKTMPSHHGIKQAVKSRAADPTLRLLLERGSCRVYQNKKIPAKVMDQVLEAGVRAPTGGNLQPYSIIRIENRATNAKLAKLCGQPFVGQAPVNLLFCIDWHKPSFLLSVAMVWFIAILTLLLKSASSIL